MAFAHSGPSAFHLVIGGANLTAIFPLKTFFHLEDRENGSDEAEVKLIIKPSSMDFPPNKFVTKWKPIAEEFPELHTTQGANVRWCTKQVLVRYRFRANISVDASSSPTLLLEALVLPTGTWEAAVPGPKKILPGTRPFLFLNSRQFRDFQEHLSLFLCHQSSSTDGSSRLRSGGLAMESQLNVEKNLRPISRLLTR